MITFATIREFFRKRTAAEIDHQSGRKFAKYMLESQSPERVLGYAWGAYQRPADQRPFDQGIRAEVREHVARLRSEVTQ